ncbi:MAG: PhnD/SsuA/transferrin family substrate-binding protein [Cyclobacteriaceae bacterium]
MHKYRMTLWSLAFAITLSASCSDPGSLRLATYTYASNNRIANLEPLARLLEEELDRPVDIKSYPDVASFISGIKSDEVDIALINTLGYLLLSLDNQNMEVVTTLKVVEDAQDNYKTVLLTNISNIQSLDGLYQRKGDLSMTFVAEGSTSGNLVPRLLLSSIGIKSPETEFRSVAYGGNHTSTFEQLVRGETDLCAIGSNEYFMQLEANPSISDSIQLLWISEEIPLGPVLVNRGLSKDDSDKITELLLQLHQTNDKVLQYVKAGWSEAKQAEKYYPITDSYYDDFRRVNGNSTDLSEILNLFKD